ncbi:MAG TPA: CinA family protein [Thermomicrobiales bacterium]|nr:CinA family protein [Thermomicrobiales bacterium]
MCNSIGLRAVRDDARDLSTELGHRLRSRRLTIATAESCTGGGIALAITSVSGSSEYFEGAVVAYSNTVKERLLGVSVDTLTSVGVVSERCAREMAAGVRRAVGADVGVASTGIAGPGGATPRKPVGLVYIAVATPDGVAARKLTLTGDRAAIMRDAADEAMRLAFETVGALAP